jgi:dolichol-phosphate mannosyltransferase
MDCDLQDRPEEIVNLYQKALEGYDIVLARRHERQDGFFKRFFSWLFYYVLSYLTGIKHDPAVANFGIYHRKVIQAVCQMRESIRVFPIMVRWTGFKTAKIDVIHAERTIGKTTYNFKRLLNLALDIILAYSDKPIRLTIKLGLTISILSFLFGLFLLFEYFFGVITVPGYASIIISIWFLSGLIIMILGIIGLYVGKIFEGVRSRPIYIVHTKLN